MQFREVMESKLKNAVISNIYLFFGIAGEKLIASHGFIYISWLIFIRILL